MVWKLNNWWGEFKIVVDQTELEFPGPDISDISDIQIFHNLLLVRRGKKKILQNIEQYAHGELLDKKV